MLPLSEILAIGCIAWYVFIVLVCTIGCFTLIGRYSLPPSQASSSHPDFADDAPHVTVLRPCKGQEPYLYECLSSTFDQDYPSTKLTVHFCVKSRDDPAYETIRRVLDDHPDKDGKVFVEDEDKTLHDGSKKMGPNPKIRNMSRAYREAKGDLVWILDCNVWVQRGACGRMVDRLQGYKGYDNHDVMVREGGFKFVHHLPIVAEVGEEGDHGGRPGQEDGNAGGRYEDMPELKRIVSIGEKDGKDTFGGLLDEMFLSTAHAKMYVAINVVAVAPCICGKSSMFRRSHLNALTSPDPNSDELASSTPTPGTGIDYFSENICEDHLIGDLLWKKKLPGHLWDNDWYSKQAKNWGNHGLVMGDVAFQPVAGMSVGNYMARRVRWLRVRKYTVPVATLVEPGTESFLCSTIGVVGLCTSRYTKEYIPISSKVTAGILLWLLSVSIWMVVDWLMYRLCQSGATIEGRKSKNDWSGLPVFAKGLKERKSAHKRDLGVFRKAWLLREALALPIWLLSLYGGEVVWRDKKLYVGMDMKVHEMNDGKKAR